MAAEVFVDTSAWYPIAVEDHPDHGWLSDALTAAIGGGRRVVTTNLIVAETYALLAARTGPSSALDFVRAVRKPPNEVVSSTPELEDSATRWLGRQWPGYSHPDWVISFTDAVSFLGQQNDCLGLSVQSNGHRCIGQCRHHQRDDDGKNANSFGDLGKHLSFSC